MYNIPSIAVDLLSFAIHGQSYDGAFCVENENAVSRTNGLVLWFGDRWSIIQQIRASLEDLGLRLPVYLSSYLYNLSCSVIDINDQVAIGCYRTIQGKIPYQN
jgi:hypothetical protein